MASLYFKYAAMNSGKSTQLIQTHFNYIERGLNPYAMTSILHDRDGTGVICARVGLNLKVDAFELSCNLYKLVQKKHDIKALNVVIIDEGQFLTKSQCYQLAQVVDELKIPVIVYGLKTDFRGELFEGSYHLFCLADKIEELKTICWCGNKAHMNARITQDEKVVRDGDQLEIGGNDRYIALCRKHYTKGQIKR
ncbi:MAG: thymidine kinase [Candidatus Cloacimonadota bacterium]|nr:MAG: thymidine kinase [Candidatus Cloacimonadota bacterium]